MHVCIQTNEIHNSQSLLENRNSACWLCSQVHSHPFKGTQKNLYRKKNLNKSAESNESF